MKRTLRSTLLAATAGLAIVPAAALAQVPPPLPVPQTEPLLPVPAVPVGRNLPELQVPPERGLTVVDRQRPEISPLGVHVGSFYFYPRAELDEAFNDNIFATASHETSDFITALAPSFDLRSDFPTNALNLSAGTVISRYARHSQFNTDDAFGQADGRLDVNATHDIHGLVRVDRLHEDPGAPNVPGNVAQPIVFTNYTATAGFAQTRLRIGYSVDGSVLRQEYQAVPVVGGGLLPQSDRDNNAYEGAVRAYYEFQPNYQAFVRGAYNIRDYDHVIAGGVTRDSHGFRGDLGARIDLTGITYFEGFIGYLQQDYRSAVFGTVSGFDVGANLVWNPTQLTSVTLRAGRTVEDTNPAIAGGGASPAFLHTSAGVNIDHELLRNVLLNGFAAYANDDFKGINRTDNTYDVGAGFRYLLNRYLYLGATYTYEHRDSNGSAAINPFSRNIILLRVSTQL